MKLVGKIIIKGSLVTKTGLHLGGSKSSLNIGGIDNNVIKTARNIPYIPGSSIKGKLRSLLAKTEGSLFFSKEDQDTEEKIVAKLIEKKQADTGLVNYQSMIKKSTNDEDCGYIIELFGYSGDSTKRDKITQTRLLVRDAFLENEKDDIFKNGFTDSKWENVIDRKTGTAEHPRQLERVPIGASFDLELVYNIYREGEEDKDAEKVNKHLQAILLALKLLEDDGLGGSISRGYGQVKVGIKTVEYKLIDEATMSYLVSEPIDLKQQQLLAELQHGFNDDSV